MLLVELALATVLLWKSAPPPPPPPAAPSSATVVPAAPHPGPVASMVLPDGRTARLLALGGQQSQALLNRLGAELGEAAAAVTTFWGPDWPQDIEIAVAGSDQQFRVLAGGAPDIAATTTAQRIMFAPGAAEMSPAALRIVLRHELFHYAARSRTAADAPRWLTEGVADYVGRPPAARPGPAQAAVLAQVPTDADLDTPGAARSLAYDRAWWFSRYVADAYGAPTLRELYQRACGPGHPDVATAVRQTLGADLDAVVAGWHRWLTG
ncbi:peptidase [Mycobacterium sp. CBMA247]|nr:peptidase [Mycolicibacterium sp. CBMA 329]MUL91464.1 peptidase [Mycolicibacterium sp. CBMA 331]MUM02942.1 peptidase [Mycolicibacterium sp. CBMA 334]MUM25955.1 peptidase [Mycolicibacterium sp. CBMA 295]MUM41888.1 peptidase [Mycolicibacterium sp. CBMA 247]MUM47419.1 peptidase [Mycolicibacterium sp. CBMA 294]